MIYISIPFVLLCYKSSLCCGYQVDEALWVTEKAVLKAKSEWKEARALMEDLMLKPQLLTFKAWVWAAATVRNLAFERGERIHACQKQFK